MSDDEITRRLIRHAYEMGWRHACEDHIAQSRDREHPIGRSMRHDVRLVIAELDPNNLLGLLDGNGA